VFLNTIISKKVKDFYIHYINEYTTNMYIHTYTQKYIYIYIYMRVCVYVYIDLIYKLHTYV